MELAINKRYLIKQKDGLLEITVLEKNSDFYKIKNMLTNAVGWIEVPSEQLPEAAVVELDSPIQVALNKFVNT